MDVTVDHTPPHTVSVVIPVYRGARTLPPLLAELEPYMQLSLSADGHCFVVQEVILSHDNGNDDSDVVMRELARRYPAVRCIWLSRNFGQHAATLAGMASSTGDWVLTMDEDGQHDPSYLPAMLDVAMREQSSLVYGRPTNPAPHGVVRNLTSRLSKRLVDVLSGSKTTSLYQSYRLILGEYARKAGTGAGNGVYMDIAMSWIAKNVTTCPVMLRDENDRPSGYSYRSLFSHFRRMVLTSGTRLLRMVSVTGTTFALCGLLVALALIVNRFTTNYGVPGWTSLIVLILLTSGVLMLSIGVVAEYLGITVHMALGRPLYLTVSDPAAGPLGRPPRRPDPRTAGPTGPAADPAVGPTEAGGA